jgi:AraC-like DNA-binding protein
MAIQCFYLLLHPEILYTQTFEKEASGKSGNTEKEVHSNHTPQTATQQVKDTAPDKSVEIKFSENELMQIEAAIQHVMDTQQPYVKQRYTLHEFAVDTQIATHKLSAFINTRYGKNFNDFLNRYRIALVIERLQSGENAHKTLEAIANECGFQSRVTFIRAFKKEHGTTPSDYISKMKGTEPDPEKRSIQ